MTVAEVQEKVSPEEFRWWMAYNRLSPIGPERQDYNSALIASTIVNVNKVKGKSVKVSDMLLEWGAPKKMARGVDQIVKVLSSIPLMKKIS